MVLTGHWAWESPPNHDTVNTDSFLVLTSASSRLSCRSASRAVCDGQLVMQVAWNSGTLAEQVINANGDAAGPDAAAFPIAASWRAPRTLLRNPQTQTWKELQGGLAQGLRHVDMSSPRLCYIFSAWRQQRRGAATP